MDGNMSQVPNAPAALSGSQILNKNQHSPLPQPLSLPAPASSLPSENAGRPHQNSALPPSSVTSTSAAAGKPSDRPGPPPAFVADIFKVSSNMANPKEKTPMCLVNELARFNKVQPQYKLLSEQGPAHSKVIPLGRWQDYGLLERVGEDRPRQMFTVQLTLGDQYWEAEGTSIKKAQHAAATKALEGTKFPKPTARPSRGEGNNPDSITPTVELNALCMKLGRKPIYKALDPYTGIRSPYSYNMRGGAYPPRYFYPFPVPPLLYQVELSIGGQLFHGKGRTRQAAKHDAAAKALKCLQHEPLLNKPELNGKAADEENLNKSEISQVFEIALKRNLPVNFEVTKESGPPHMKSFITKVSVGDFSGEGEGKSKKISKKNAATAVLQELKKLPPLPTVEKMKPRIKKKTKSIVKLPTSPEYGQGMNPISRLAQIQQAKKEKEPEYILITEKGLPRRREFVMQVKVGNLTADGSGTNKKVAKRNAAENMLELLGFKIPPPPPKPALKTEEKTPLKKPGDGRKVTFYEPGSGESDTVNSNKEDEFRMPYHSHQQLPAGILPMVPEVAQAVGVNKVLNTKEFNRVAPNPAKATLTAMIARELLYARTSPTADAILKNSNSSYVLHGPLLRPSEQLDFLSNVQGIQVEYKDFPKNNKNEFVSLINCSSQPPLISHGIGKDVETCHDMAALNILKLLSELDQQSTDLPRTGNGPMSVCVKPEMESEALLKPANSNTLGQTLDSTA